VVKQVRELLGLEWGLKARTTHWGLKGVMVKVGVKVEVKRFLKLVLEALHPCKNFLPVNTQVVTL